MKQWKCRMAAAWIAFGVLALCATVPTEVPAQGPAVDPAATQILKRMTDYLGGLKQFSVSTQNSLEDLLPSGHRVDFDLSVRVTVKRPNKLRAERKGLLDQRFFYDGKTLTLYNPSDKVYATKPAPDTIDKMIGFARESIGVVLPAADLVYSNAYPLLMEEVVLAAVVGKTTIDGVKCDHLFFSRPGVDFQVWVAEGNRPLPYKYVVTDTSIPALLSVVTVMSNWNTAPAVSNDHFAFVPPKGAKAIPFMPLETAGGSGR
jgi:hypothetical protein